MVLLDTCTIKLKDDVYTTCKIGQVWKNKKTNFCYYILNIMFDRGKLFFFVLNLKSSKNTVVELEDFESLFSFHSDNVVDSEEGKKSPLNFVLSVQNEINSLCEMSKKTEERIKSLNEKIEQLECYESYSYYVGEEVSMNRTPMKFGTWVSKMRAGEKV